LLQARDEEAPLLAPPEPAAIHPAVLNDLLGRLAQAQTIEKIFSVSRKSVSTLCLVIVPIELIFFSIRHELVVGTISARGGTGKAIAEFLVDVVSVACRMCYRYLYYHLYKKIWG
jgi:hypothetical protein